MTEFRDQGVTAFIGPDKSCRQEALIASAWNLPMIAFVSINFKQQYRRLKKRATKKDKLFPKTCTKVRGIL